MSWLERVKRAGNELPDSGISLQGGILESLREKVHRLVSVDDIATMARDNPERAKNEVRSACKRVFEESYSTCFPVEQRDALTEDLVDAIFGFGLLEDMLADESITEIMVNGPSQVYFEREGRLYHSEKRFGSEGELRALIDRILGPVGRRIDEASPMVNARLPQGHRVNVVIPPIAMNGPTMTIRKFAEQVMTLQDMLASKSIDAQLMVFLVWLVKARRNLAVSGGTGSGKTTLLNALSCEIPPEERIITIEDSAELRFFEHPHVVSMEARPRNTEGCGEVSIRDLVTNALRMRPDRIIVGECRGAEALDMLQAMSTGHDGSLTTLHANSPEESISRLTTMVRFGADLPVDVIEANIANAIDVVIQMQRSLDGRRYVSELVGFTYNRERERCESTALYQRNHGDEVGRWFELPAWLDEQLVRYIPAEEVGLWKQRCLLAA